MRYYLYMQTLSQIETQLKEIIKKTGHTPQTDDLQKDIDRLKKIEEI